MMGIAAAHARSLPACIAKGDPCFPPVPWPAAARAKRQSLAAQQERSSILDSMTRLEVESSTLARAAKAAARDREEGLVEVDVGKLEVRRLRLLLSR